MDDMIERWKYLGHNDHVLSYDRTCAWIWCSCGHLATRISGSGSKALGERHVRNKTRSMGSLVFEEIKNHG